MWLWNVYKCLRNDLKDTVNNYSICVRKRGTLHFRKVLERYQIAFVRLDDALDEAIRSNDELESYVDDMAKVEYLAQFSPTLMKLFMFFSKMKIKSNFMPAILP